MALVVKQPACQCRRYLRHGLDPWVRTIPWRRACQPTPVFLLGESPWTNEPGGLQSMGWQRVGHNWATKNTHMHNLILCLRDFHCSLVISHHYLHGVIWPELAQDWWIEVMCHYRAKVFSDWRETFSHWLPVPHRLGRLRIWDRVPRERRGLH